MAVVVAIILIAVGTMIYKKNKESRLSRYSDFNSTFQVFALNSSFDEPGEQMMLTFSGEKNMRGEFRGDITIKSGETTILYYHDCEVIRTGEGIFVTHVNDGWTPDMSYPKPNRLGGALYADADWERFVFQPTLSEYMAETDYVVFVSPATNHSEAYELYKALR